LTKEKTTKNEQNMKKNLIALLLTITTINVVYSQSWFSRQSLPSTSRYAAPGFSIGNIGYIIGGESSIGNLTDVWAYNSVLNSWSTRPSFPGTSRNKAVAFSINGMGYYGLGTDSTFYKFDPTSNTWSQLSNPNLGISYWSSMYFTIGNDAYFLFASTNTFVKYSTVTNSWTTLANFPGIQRFTGSGFSINNKGYITCGASGFGSPYLNDLWEYDPANNSWSQKSSLPATGRYASIAYSMNGIGYILCGERYNPNTTLSEFWQYNPISDSWTQLQSFIAGARNYLSGFVIGNNIYAGFGGFGYHSDFYLYGTICNNLVSINNSIVNASSNSNAIFIGSSNNPNSTFQWQSNPNYFGWQNVPNNSIYSGNSTNSLTVNNVQLSNHLQPFRLIATTGNCIDTSNVATINITDTCIVTINDTITTLISVTDTLIINTLITGLTPPNNLNTIKVFPNPTNDHITIDFGNFASMNGYILKITNSIGQIVFTTPINQQSSYIDLSTWSGNGIYFVQIIDTQNNTIENRKIVLQ
jgi:N-acetylneuraminic acid mutarotase